MVYEVVPADQPLAQGDIFTSVPRVDFSMDHLYVAPENGEDLEEMDWASAAASNKPITALLTLKPVLGIVISQNCDAARGEYITLAQVDKYSDIFKSLPTSARKWASQITRASRENLRYFYLPRSDDIGIPERMAADFRVCLKVPRAGLASNISLRLGRLNQVAGEHFRESLAQFFRRYPYDEWYPLDREEFAAYQNDSSEPVEPFSWQKEPVGEQGA